MASLFPARVCTLSLLLAPALGLSSVPSSTELRRALIARRAAPTLGGLLPADVERLLDQYIAAHPPIDPAHAARGELARGTWRVVHAPHIEQLGRVLGVEFDVTYELDARDGISSHVRYGGALTGGGFLSARGAWAPLDARTVRVIWEDIWWSPGAEVPVREPPSGALAQLVQRIGRAGMLPELSAFPVELLASTLCAFRFRPTDSRVVAAKLVEGEAVW